ncbi:Ulp1 family isopeptidase [Bradyrhizobium sp. B120]|uniref:Ulp1 family isopeptidase n=1 Tax=Bradyrhizobium sp. B120 TaxID=3410088 RepID=UPI003B9835C7
MNPINSIDPWNTESWVQRYAARQEQQPARQQAGNMPAGQAGFEQQLSELQLSSSDESSAEGSSPDASPADGDATAAEGEAYIQRTDIGDSIRSRSNLPTKLFPSTRYGLDAPDADSNSLQFRPSTSLVDPYQASSEARESSSRPHSERHRLLSRFKEGVKGIKKALGLSSRNSLSRASNQEELPSTELRMYFAKRRNAIEPFESDQVLISRFMRASVGSVFMHTAQRNASYLRNFSAWLNEHERSPIADRLNEPGLENDALDYAQEMDPAGNKEIKDQVIEALTNVRQSDLPPVELSDDEKLISEFREAAKSAGRKRDTVSRWVLNLQKFVIWLRSKTLTLSSLLDRPDELKRLATLYVEKGGKKDVHPALKVLREFHIAKAQGRSANFNPLLRQRLAAPPAEDAELMSRFKTAAREAGVPKNTIDSILIHAKKFANWLHENNKDLLASRFRDDTLADDIDEYKAQGNDPKNLLDSTLAHLRRLGPGGENIEQMGPGPRLMGRRLLHPYPADGRLIDGMLDEALRGVVGWKQRWPFQQKASRLRGFSDWLQREGRGSIVGRLSGDGQQHAFDQDLEEFEKTNTKLPRAALRMLQNYLQAVEANRALGLPVAGQEDSPAEAHAGSYDGEYPWEVEQASGQEPAGSTSTWSPQLPQDFNMSEWPTPEAMPLSPVAARSSDIYGGLESLVDLPSTPHELRNDARSVPVPSASAARSSDAYGGLESLVDLPSTPYEVRDDAQSAPVVSLARPPFVVGPSGAPQELQDIGYLIGDDWGEHGSRPVSDVQIDILENLDLLPNRFSGPSPVLINGELYLVSSGPGGRRDFQFVYQPRQIGASVTGASSVDSARLLGHTDWLGDEHIQRDYELLEQELRRSNPDLAARTRFVDPLIATMLSHGDPGTVSRELRRLASAAILFVPVNDAAPGGRNRGSHWSFLLVDRRNQARPVAYHYDSNWGYNAGPAARLADQLGANLERATMRQQDNGYDCGVFVLDGTRELVRRLAATQWPDLSLNNLDVNRRALQERLNRPRAAD